MRLIVFVIIILWGCPAYGSVTVYTNKQQWETAVGSFSSITFTGFPEFTIITNQFEHLGIVFSDGDDSIDFSASFPSDGHGLVSNEVGTPGTIGITATGDLHAFGFDFIGYLQVDLLNEGSLLFSSSSYHADFAPFFGVVSTDPFDEIFARDWHDGTVALDNIHFGPPIPAPHTFVLLGAGLLLSPRRCCRR
jgi:hypothetical protein